jgi:alanyl-tRNA synthetase
MVKFGRDMKRLRLKNVVYLYRLAKEHLSRMDHLKLEEVEENIGVVIEFVQKVEANFRETAAKGEGRVDLELFSERETFHVLGILRELNVQESPLYR